MQCTFTPGAWQPEAFDQVTSLRTDGRRPFMQEADAIVNDTPKKELNAHAYCSLLCKEQLNAPAHIECVCAFERFGAPLIVFTDDLIQTDDGFPAYGHHFEVVAFEEGINIWDLNGTAQPILAGKMRFPVKAGQFIELSVRVEPGSLTVSLGGETETFAIPNLPASFRAGFTACEGVNRFYSFACRPL